MAFSASKTAQRDDRGRLSIWMAAVGELPAWEVTAAHLRAGIAIYERAGYSPGYLNRLVNSVGSVYKWAIAEGKAPSQFTSPTLQVKRKPETPRVFIAPPEKIERLRAIVLADPDRRFACWVAAGAAAATMRAGPRRSGTPGSS